MLRRDRKPPDKSTNVDEDVLIADGGAEQCLLGVIWRIIYLTGHYVHLLGPLASGRHDNGTIFQVVSAVAQLIDENGKAWFAIVHFYCWARIHEKEGGGSMK